MSEEYTTQLEGTLFQVNQYKRSNKYPRRPRSEQEVGDRTLPIFRRPRRNPRVELCGDIRIELNSSISYSTQCGDDFEQIFTSYTSTIISDTIGDSDVCEHLCDGIGNPCQNLGKCREYDDGYACECQEGFGGKYCEEGPQCDYYAAFQCLDIFTTSSSYFSNNFQNVYCSSISRSLSCLSKHLLVCSEPDFAFVQLIYFYLESLQTSCIIEEKPTCEQMDLYVTFSEVVNVFYSYPGPANSDRDYVCQALRTAYESVQSINLRCADKTILSVTASNKLEGAMDVFCNTPTCSFTVAFQCLEEMYYLLLEEPFASAKCQDLWVQKKCVLDASLDCGPVKMNIILGALDDLELINPAMDCPNPCKTKPCRNGGKCRQTTVDDYQCICTEDYTGEYCQTPKGCNFDDVRLCLESANQLIVDGIYDRCHPSSDCSTIERLLNCIDINTKKCGKDVLAGVSKIKFSLTSLKKESCEVVQPFPDDPVCDVPPTSCNIYAIEECYATFTNIAFAELASSCAINYAKICSYWTLTLECIEKASVQCTEPVKETINLSIEWLTQLTSSTCLKAVCLPELAPPANLCIKSETSIFELRPSVPDNDRSAFCTYVGGILNVIESNVQQCASATKKTVLDQVSTTRNSLEDSCTFPCQKKPCKNDGVCVETSYEDYECKCVGDYSGKNCDQIALYPHDDDTELHCREDRVIDFAEIKLAMPIKVYCESMHYFSVGQDGYVSFSSTSVVISEFSHLCQNGQNLLAPLFAKQDCSCTGSRVSYKVYNPSETSAQKYKVFGRASRDKDRFKLPAAFTPQVIVVVTWENMLPYPCSVFKETYPDRKGSTYQLVLLSDSNSTYTEFLYESTDTSQQAVDVHQGYTGTNGRCFGSYLSGTLSMNHFERVETNTGYKGAWVYPMIDSCVPPKKNPEDQCFDWVVNTIDLSQEHLESCSCSSQQASLDPRYHIEYIDWFRHCYVLNRIQKIVKSTAQFKVHHVKQVCCYDQFNKGALYSTPPYAGYPAVIDPAEGEPSDADAYNLCCVQSNKYCNLYRSKRPSATCNEYTSCMEGLMWGDPHMSTTDNVKYTFNGIGEFWMINTTDGSFRLQARTAQMTTTSGQLANASSYVAFVAQETGSPKVQVEMNAERDGILLYVDGAQKETTGVPKIYNTDIYISATNTAVNVTFTSGWTTTIGIGMKMLAIRQTVPGVAWKKTRGLLGVYNADPSDDFTAPDGTVIPIDSSTEDIHNKFGMKWLVTPDESLFKYPTGKKASDFVNKNFVPAFEPPCFTNEEKSTGKELCGDSKDCYYDYCVTKDEDIARGTRSTVNGYDSSRQILTNLGPKLSINGFRPDSKGVYSIPATVGKEVQLTLYAQSAQTVKINIEMLGNVSKEAKVSLGSLTTTPNSTSSLFKWTPSSLSAVDVSFIAMDANGAISARMQVIVIICNGCGDQGTCDYASSSPINNGTAYRLADCDCKIGWAGSTCSQDYDGCESNTCASTAACQDLTAAQQAATGLAFSCSACPPGYHTEQCIDIDECSTLPANSKCQICVNIVGSYTCKCRKGYRLSATNEHECEDIDECAELTSGCPQSCTNTIGSFTCNCREGYAGKGCDAIKPCGKNSCAYKCAMIDDVQTCSCMSGFMLNSDGTTCTDINECSNPELNRCSIKSKCNNTIGGYTCGCAVGALVGEDLRTCEPCSDTTWGPSCMNACNCGPNVLTCSKTDGCTICRNGWQGLNCVNDVDECATGTAKCQKDATCLNTEGTYYCICADGSGSNCYEIVAPIIEMTPCPINHCQNGGSCFLDSKDHAICSCSNGYAGEACDVIATQLSSSTNIGLIAGLSTLGAVLLIAAAILIGYCFVYPRMKKSKKYDPAKSELTSSEHGLTKFDQTSTRINKFWPRNPQRYTPETYTSAKNDEPNV